MCKNKSEYRPVSAMVLSRNFAGNEEFLIVKKPRKNYAWQFPQGGVDDGETFLEASERELMEECGENLRINFLFNESIGEYQYNYPESFRRHYGEYMGAKVLFFRGILKSGEVEIDNQEIIDHKWVSREEFSQYFEASYLNSIENFI